MKASPYCHVSSAPITSQLGCTIIQQEGGEGVFGPPVGAATQNLEKYSGGTQVLDSVNRKVL